MTFENIRLYLNGRLEIIYSSVKVLPTESDFLLLDSKTTVHNLIYSGYVLLLYWGYNHDFNRICRTQKTHFLRNNVD